MIVSVRVPTRLTHDSLIELPQNTDDTVELDASILQFVQPIGLVQLALTLRRLGALAQQIRFIAPDNTDVELPS